MSTIDRQILFAVVGLCAALYVLIFHGEGWCFLCVDW